MYTAGAHVLAVWVKVGHLRAYMVGSLGGGLHMAMLGLACHTAGAHVGGLADRVGNLGGGGNMAMLGHPCLTAGAHHQVGFLAVSMICGWL